MTSTKDIVTWTEDPAHFAKPGRREFLRVGVCGALGLTLGDFFTKQAQAEQKFYESKEGRAKGIIQIVLPGGMAHQESWDPKPEAPLEYRGPWRAIETNVSGIRISEQLPQHAKHADKMVFLRSMHHKNGDHFAAAHWMLTGRYGSHANSLPQKFPSVGSYVGLRGN